MISKRSFVASGGFLACLLGLFSHPSVGQSPPKSNAPVRIEDFKAFEIPRGIGDARIRVQKFRDGQSQERLIDLSTKKPTPQNMDALNLVAKEFVYAVTDKKYYFPPEDTKKNELKPTPTEFLLESRFEVLDRFILVPRFDSKYNPDQFDYLTHFGTAMDSAIKDILEAQQPVPTIVRVNAARMLAVAARSGSPAHFPMILKYVSNPDTEPAVLNYAIKAAEGLIAAYNPLLKDSKYARHTVSDAEMVQLVSALEAVVRRTTPYGPKLKPPAKAPTPAPAPMPMGKADEKKAAAPPMPMGRGDEKKAAPPVGRIEADTAAATADEQAVIRYLRRGAIRALAQCRYSLYVDPKDGRTVRPLATLARIAIGDPSITASPGNDEIAAAIVGLANVHDFKDVNQDVLLDCIAQGIVNFLGKKTGNNKDKSIAWKGMSSSILIALQDWKQYPQAKRLEPRLGTLLTTAEKALSPVISAGVGTAPNLEPLQQWRDSKQLPDLKLYIEAPEPPLVRGFKPIGE